MALKVTRHQPHEDPDAGTSSMQLIGKLTERQRELRAKARGRRRPRP